ncbi:MAG: RNA 2',3'-cyclic phosphodiesterase [archaeon]|nr:MAG: RNA 2',3'-cyclic phosphodiesterase [archaeon]
MRCFIAIDLPSEIKDFLFNLRGKIGLVNAKFVERRNLHLTLKFFGEIDDLKVKQIQEKIQELKFKKFNVSLGNIGFFPDKNYIRVLWVSLEPSSEIKRLYDEINSVLSGIKTKEEDSKSHITLARIKTIKDKPKFLDSVSKIKIKKKSFVVDSIKLKKSVLTNKGPLYSDLLEIPLQS